MTTPHFPRSRTLAEMARAARRRPAHPRPPFALTPDARGSQRMRKRSVAHVGDPYLPAIKHIRAKKPDPGVGLTPATFSFNPPHHGVATYQPRYIGHATVSLPRRHSISHVPKYLRETQLVKEWLLGITPAPPSQRQQRTTKRVHSDLISHRTSSHRRAPPEQTYFDALIEMRNRSIEELRTENVTIPEIKSEAFIGASSHSAHRLLPHLIPLGHPQPHRRLP